ncbi:unnamed protein product [Phytophthora fragariaefolia]|uniref:Unnamed protein product n=1 Tax=Phytophthora fragariaefolia TaxID=1490495 RepID=A0A9W6Y3I2_9STRA|nr:unnamed protein product [Phytophthora fragariaefolia]
MKLQGGDAERKAIQEIEFAVLSSIALREEYKVKLRALLSVIDPQAWPDTVPPEQVRVCRNEPLVVKAKKTTTSSTKNGKSCQVAEIPVGKEIHVLGDFLLLIRVASVEVVENIQSWRAVIHNRVPRPYIYEHENYLLRMCEDLDFLDRASDLVEWLGFRLVRNPFIVNEALDDVVSSRLGISVHDARSLKYWNSASWRENNMLFSSKSELRNASQLLVPKSDQGNKVCWEKQRPPPPLVKPIASISPEDDVVDGSRIAAAQNVLLEEEGFHGRQLSLKACQEYVDRGPSKFEHCDVENNADSLTIYDAIAAAKSKLRYARLSTKEKMNDAQVEI